jgi:hypothetical protein
MTTPEKYLLACVLCLLFLALLIGLAIGREECRETERITGVSHSWGPVKWCVADEK